MSPKGSTPRVSSHGSPPAGHGVSYFVRRTGRKQMASQIVSDVSLSELKRHLNEIAQYVRLSGTPEEAKAFDHIERELKSWGYDVKRYESDALIGYPGKSSLEITSPDQQSIPCNGYSLSPLTSDEGVSGE